MAQVKITLAEEPHKRILREVVAGTLRVCHMKQDKELVTTLSEILTEIDNAERYWPDTRQQIPLSTQGEERHTGDSSAPIRTDNDDEW